MIMRLAKEFLARPLVFDSYQWLVGMPQCHKRFIAEMVCPVAGERVLDVGCGVGASLRYMPDNVDYTGVDVSASYIEKAKAEHGNRGRFICADVSTLNSASVGNFDRAFCVGVLHHLPDDVAAQAVEFVRRVVKPGGVFVSIDPCYVPGQHFIPKLVIDNDRGEYVRDAAGFERIVSGLGQVRREIHHDLLRIPFTQIVMWVMLDGEAGQSTR